MKKTTMNMVYQFIIIMLLLLVTSIIYLLLVDYFIFIDANVIKAKFGIFMLILVSVTVIMGFLLSYKLDVLIKKIILWIVAPFKEQQVIISSMNCNGTRTVSISTNNDLILTHHYEWTLNVTNDITGEEKHCELTHT